MLARLPTALRASLAGYRPPCLLYGRAITFRRGKGAAAIHAVDDNMLITRVRRGTAGRLYRGHWHHR